MKFTYICFLLTPGTSSDLDIDHLSEGTALLSAELDNDFYMEVNRVELLLIEVPHPEILNRPDMN